LPGRFLMDVAYGSFRGTKGDYRASPKMRA
jgi:hypothetical protein